MSGIALITGGQRGIGLGIAKDLVAAGFRVAVMSEVAVGNPEVQAALDALGHDARYYQHNVTDIEQVAQMLDQVENDLGPITTFISNAGIGARVRADMLDLEPTHFDLVHNVNLRGAFFLAQQVAKRMIAQEDGHYRSMIFVTSVSAEMASVERAEYCMSKAGAAMMSNLFAVRLAPHGVGVFELRPGIIATDMTAGVKDKYTDLIQNGLVPAARWGEARDIGEIVVPLATGQMRFANGAVIPVDGGLSIPRL